jgi:hypothetical protein
VVFEYWSWLIEFPVQEIFNQNQHQSKINFPNGKFIKF